MKHSESKLQLTVEIITAVAVIISLVFVGFQMKETAKQTALNTKSLQVSAYQELISQILEYNQLLIEPNNIELANYIYSPDASLSELSPGDLHRARSILYILFRHADMAFYQYQQGMLPIERLRSSLGPLASLNPPAYREAWDLSKENFVPEFRSFIESEFELK